MRRRSWGAFLLVALGACSNDESPPPAVATLDLEAPEVELTFVLEANRFAGWEVIEGTWEIQHVADDDVLVQTATNAAFPRILAPAPPSRDFDVSVEFLARSGVEDASGGIVFRAVEDRYYVVRANCLEHNLRLYAHSGPDRWLVAGTRIRPPAPGEWHHLRVVAVGPRIQAHLDGELLLDVLDGRFTQGRAGLWTKADAVTAFRNLLIRSTGVH